MGSGRFEIQEVYAHPPADMLLAATNHGHASAQQAGRTKHVKGGGNKHGKGHHHKQSSSGNDGYKHYDAFHTKSGDKYGYEKHSSFGKKKKGGRNERYGSAHDAGFAGSHPDVEVVLNGPAQARMRQGPRSQSLQDMSGDASVDHENTKYRRGLHDDDMFFVFSADGNENQDDGEGQQQQQASDDDDHDDDGEAAEQQEAEDDDEDDDGQRQQQQQQAEDDYDY